MGKIIPVQERQFRVIAKQQKIEGRVVFVFTAKRGNCYFLFLQNPNVEC
jgi:hypothetical protein